MTTNNPLVFLHNSQNPCVHIYLTMLAAMQ